MPSVMATMTATPASAASMMASAAPAGGTKIMLALAPVCLTASATVLNTGRAFFDSSPVHVVPPRPGVTPPTNWRAVEQTLVGVKASGLAGDALADDPGVLIDQDAHVSFPRRGWERINSER